MHGRSADCESSKGELPRSHSNVKRYTLYTDTHVHTNTPIRTDAGDFSIQILLISSTSGPDPICQTLGRRAPGGEQPAEHTLLKCSQTHTDPDRQTHTDGFPAICLQYGSSLNRLRIYSSIPLLTFIQFCYNCRQ